MEIILIKKEKIKGRGYREIRSFSCKEKGMYNERRRCHKTQDAGTAHARAGAGADAAATDRIYSEDHNTSLFLYRRNYVSPCTLSLLSFLS